MSSLVGFIKVSAPHCFAISSFPSFMSIAMICEAPAFLQPIIALRPRAPRPNIAQLLPRLTFAVLIALMNKLKLRNCVKIDLFIYKLTSSIACAYSTT
jgi:hypothetical protein